MAWNESDTRLRDLLATLYSDVADAKRIARDALLDLTQIDFSGKPITFWSEIIKFAKQNGQILDLIREAKKEYPGNKELRKLEQILAVHYGQTPLEIPPLLPYLPDRNPHKNEIQKSICKLHNHGNRPVVYIIHGDKRQSHDMFLERMREDILPRLLPPSSQEIGIQRYSIRWLNTYRDERELKQWFINDLSERILGKITNNIEGVNKVLGSRLKPVMIDTHVTTEDWSNISPLESFLRVWNSWPDIIFPYPLILCFCIKYQDTNKLGWFKRYQRNKQNKQIEKEFKNLDLDGYKKLHLIPLPALHNVSHRDVEDWARLPQVKELCPLDKLLHEISQLFKVQEEIPMDQLANNLKQILLRPATQS